MPQICTGFPGEALVALKKGPEYTSYNNPCIVL